MEVGTDDEYASESLILPWPTGSYFFTLSSQYLMVRAQKDRKNIGKGQIRCNDSRSSQNGLLSKICYHILRWSYCLKKDREWDEDLSVL